MAECSVELFWIPVGAGTSRFQRACLWIWEGTEALRARRARATLLHSALKLTFGDGEAYTVELMPDFIRNNAPPLLTGPVGLRAAGRSRLFRYQLAVLAVDHLPDEEWAVTAPSALSRDCAVARRLLTLGANVPPYTWGRRVAGTTEMWTSDSVVSLMLSRAGVDLEGIGPPEGGRAPGWFAGLELARAEGRAGG